LYATHIPTGYVPLIFENNPFSDFNKHKQMILLNERPPNMEAQAHLLNDDVTPVDKMFVRNNGLTPDGINLSEWKLEIDGE
jgi:sulfite oxidase